MFIDDDLPVKKPELVFRKLDALSVKALNEYIAELEAEIARARTEIGTRGNARNAAESFFKKKDD